MHFHTAKLTHEQIAQDIQAFLDAGKRITKCPAGAKTQNPKFANVVYEDSDGEQRRARIGKRLKGSPFRYSTHK